ncbi:MAG TPA: replication initiation protein [Victivallales bacterium]|nr:replication initiation protein [Victivallales bacterium]
MSNLIKYHNNFVQAIYSTDLIAKKLLVGISHKIQNIDKFGVEVEFNLKEIAELTGIKRGSLGQIEKAVNNLMQTIITAKNPNDNEEWIKFQLMGDSKYVKGKLTTKISPYMQPFLMELKKRFTTYHIENIKPLRSNYSIRIYEMLCQFKNTGIFNIKVSDFRKKLDIEDKYKLFSNFRKKVLEQAKKELKANCDLFFEYKIEKIGTVAHMIKFKIFRQQILKSSKLTQEDYREIYNSERLEALSLLVENPTEKDIEEFRKNYEGKPEFFDGDNPKPMALEYFMTERLNFPSFEEWKKNQKE